MRSSLGPPPSRCHTRVARFAADPASPDSVEVVTQQAGQVWFPDSAYKTATAIRDFNCAGERLPLIVFANWRGFRLRWRLGGRLTVVIVAMQWRHARHV